jgi:hypothetical protein
MPRVNRGSRCTYKEGNRRCPYDGEGAPVLCRAHRIALAELAKPRAPAHVLLEALGDLLQGKPINREATIGAAEDFLNRWAGTIGADYRPDIMDGESENSVHRRGQPGTGRPWWWDAAEQAGRATRDPRGPRTTTGPGEPTQDENLARARAAARHVLGYQPGDRLDAAEIKKRHRLLVLKHHPDRAGGSQKKMAAINAARDVLMAELEG